MPIRYRTKLWNPVDKFEDVTLGASGLWLAGGTATLDEAFWPHLTALWTTGNNGPIFVNWK